MYYYYYHCCARENNVYPRTVQYKYDTFTSLRLLSLQDKTSAHVLYQTHERSSVHTEYISYACFTVYISGTSKYVNTYICMYIHTYLSMHAVGGNLESHTYIYSVRIHVLHREFLPWNADLAREL